MCLFHSVKMRLARNRPTTRANDESMRLEGIMLNGMIERCEFNKCLRRASPPPLFSCGDGKTGLSIRWINFSLEGTSAALVATNQIVSYRPHNRGLST